MVCLRLRAAGWWVMSDEHPRSVHFGDPATLRAMEAIYEELAAGAAARKLRGWGAKRSAP